MESNINISIYQRIYLDTSLYIYFFENNQEFANKVEQIFLLSTKKHISIVASTLLLTELLVAPLREQNEILIELYKNLQAMIPTIVYTDLNYQIGVEAANIRAKYNIGVPDAIHLATAKVKQVDVFITPDRNLRKIKEIEMLII